MVVALGICLVYVMMQTFAVPGTLSLSILSGAVLGLGPGLTLVTGKRKIQINLSTCLRPTCDADVCPCSLSGERCGIIMLLLPIMVHWETCSKDFVALKAGEFPTGS